MKFVTKALAAMAIVMAAFTASPATAEDSDDWVLHQTSNDGTVISWSMKDILAGRPNNTRATLWSRMEAPDESFQLVKFEVNCVSESYRLAYVSSYNRDGTNISSERGTREVSPFIPGTLGEQPMKLLCMSAEEFQDWADSIKMEAEAEERNRTPATFS